MTAWDISLFGGEIAMLAKKERIRQRIKLATLEDKVKEKLEETLSKAMRKTDYLFRFGSITEEDKLSIISDKMVEICAKHRIDVVSLTDNIHAAEKVRVDKIKLEEEKLKPKIEEEKLDESRQ